MRGGDDRRAGQRGPRDARGATEEAIGRTRGGGGRGSVKADGTIVVIGGSSGIGLAVARRSLDDGATVVIAGRSQRRLDAARAELTQAEGAQAEPPAGRLSAHPADIGDLAQVARLFERVGTLSHLVVTAADLPYGPAVSLSEDSMVR